MPFEGMACDTRWAISYAPDLISRNLNLRSGELVLCRDSLRLILLNDRGHTVDARFLREGETILVRGWVQFPCHIARADSWLQAPESSSPATSAATSRVPCTTSVTSIVRRTVTASTDPGILGPRPRGGCTESGAGEPLPTVRVGSQVITLDPPTCIPHPPPPPPPPCLSSPTRFEFAVRPFLEEN